MAKTSAQRRFERVALVMERFTEPLPADYNEFVRRDVVPTYIFYNGKKGTGYCTTCRSDYKIKGLKHRKEAVCPVCGRKAEARSDGMSRKYPEVYWSAYTYQQDGNTLVRYYRHIVDFKDYRSPIIRSIELFRKVDNDLYMLETRDGYHFNEWDEYRDSAFFSWFMPRDSEWNVPYHLRFYEGGGFQTIRDTLPSDCKYMPFKELCEMACCEWGRFCFVPKEIVKFYRNNRYVEQLIKVGMQSLVKCLLRNERDERYFDKTQTKLIKVLRLDKRRYDLLHSLTDPCTNDLRLLQDFPEISAQDYYWLRKCGYYDYSARWLEKALRYTTIPKARKYADEHNLIVDGRPWETNAASHWGDYLGFSEELGINLHDEYYLFPKNLKEAHDKAHKEVMAVRDKRRAEEKKQESALIKKVAESKANFTPFHLHYNGLFIRLAESSEELKREGDALHHCVGGYANKMANGLTYILFVRKESDPDTPFYTMEWNGRIVQLRGMRNCDPTAEVWEFRKEFERLSQNELQKETAKAA